MMDWSGKTVAVIASGPSLAPEDCQAVERAGLPTIAVNSSWKIARFCDVIYAGDHVWWEQYGAEVDIQAERWTHNPNAANAMGIQANGKGQSVLNSGMRAIELAISFGAARIILLGYDCSVERGTHWHGDHSMTKNPDAKRCAEWQQKRCALSRSCAAPWPTTSTSDWALANTRQQQGLEYDNRAGTVFLTSLVKPSSPEVGYLIEYAAAADGTIGAEVRRSGLLPMGHSDYFAIEYDPTDGNRYVWVDEESTSSLHRIEWRSGATAADIVQTISLAGIASGRCEVSLYGADSLLLSFTRVDTGAITDHVCLLSDLAAGTFAPVWQQDITPRLGAVVPIMPHQQRKYEGGLFAGLCGLYLSKRDYTFVSVATSEGAVVGRGSYFDASAAASDEPEGFGWYWSSAHAKLLPVMTIWRPAGGVDLYGVAEPDAELEFALGGDQLSRRRWDTTGTGISQWGALADGLEAQFPLGVKQLFVGGGNYGSDDTFNPVNLRMTQVFDNATRQGGGIYAYGQSNVLSFDGSNDLTYGLGLRWFGATRAMMHITESGAFFGRTATLAEQVANKASLSGLGTAAYPVGVRGRTGNTAAAPCFLSEGGSLDYAVPSTEAMQLGGYDASAGTIATWMAINNTSIQPGADNTQSCGSPSLRWSVVYSGTGTINTSDAREKQQDRPLSEAEKAVAVRLKGMIKAFKFNDAVAAKGESARWHFGVIAQEVKAAFEAEGLVAERYAIICYDEWPEQPEVLPQPEKMDESGDVVEPAKPGKAYVAAGSRYGVRYEELLAFIISSL